MVLGHNPDAEKAQDVIEAKGVIESGCVLEPLPPPGKFRPLQVGPIDGGKLPVLPVW
jgi:hypothetical protein